MVIISQGYATAMASVLGALLMDSKYCAGDIVFKLDVEHFATAEYQNIFTAIKTRWQEERPIDATLILGDMGTDSIEYRRILLGLLEFSPTAANYREYLGLLLLEYKKYRAAVICEELGELSRVYDHEGLKGKLEELSSVIDGVDTQERPWSLSEMFVDFMGRLGTVPNYLRYGIPKLDQRLYTEMGDYIVIGARPSAGKTALALNLAAKFGEQHKTIFFSMETGYSKLADRFFSNTLHIELRKIKTGDVDDHTFVKAKENFKAQTGNQLYFKKSAGMKAEEICAVALRERAKIIIVDYIGLVASNKKTDYETVTYNSKFFHTFSQRHGVTVVCLCQLSRAGADGVPTMANLRDSGQIEQDADVIMLLYELEESGDRRMIVEKNKEGRTGRFDLGFEGEYQRFFERYSGEESGNIVRNEAGAVPLTGFKVLGKATDEEMQQFFGGV